MELLEKDKNVKILIFSVWTKMLDAIENALRDNKIKSTFGGAGNHIKAIADFKVIEQFFESLSTNIFNSFLFFFFN